MVKINKKKINKKFLLQVKNFFTLKDTNLTLDFFFKIKRKKPITIKSYSKFIEDNMDVFNSHNFIFVGKYYQFVDEIKKIQKEKHKYFHYENVFPADSEDIYMCKECNHLMVVTYEGYAFLLDYLISGVQKAYQYSCSDKILLEILDENKTSEYL